MGVKKSIDLIEIDIWIGGGRKSETYWGVWVYEWGRGRIYRGGRIGTRGRITTTDGIGSIGRIVIIARIIAVIRAIIKIISRISIDVNKLGLLPS